MHHIRTKLVLSLLVVTLIPLIPSYYLLKGLVNRSFELGFNETVETAIEGAARISRALYGHFKDESLELGVELGRSEVVLDVLRRGFGQVRPEDHQRLGEEAERMGAYVLDIFDLQNRSVVSLSRLDIPRIEEEEEVEAPEKAESSGINIGARIAEEAFKALSTEMGENPIEKHRSQIEKLAGKTEANLLEGSDDPQFISIFVPIVDGDSRLGSLILVRVMEEEFTQGARHIVAVNRIFKTLDYYKEDIRLSFLVLFVLFYVSIGALSVFVGYIFSRRLTSPLLRLVEGTQTVAAGDLDYRIEVSSKDEIGQLMDSFNKMISSIKENQQLARERELERQRVEEENQRRVKDLEMAELRSRALQAENERQTVELQKSQELERAYQELEESHRQLQEAQAQLILQEKMASLGTMVAGFAHEINNPMGAVRSGIDVAGRCFGRIERVMEESASVEELRADKRFHQAVGILKENMGVVAEAEGRVTTLVQSLKNFARLDEAEFQMADLREGVDSTLNLLHQQIGDGIELKREYGDIERTYCSPGQMNQVFMGVLKNAAQAIDGKGEIAIEIAQREGDIFIEIRDTGIGIPPEQIESIFDLEFRSTSSRVKMGSSLSMAYRIVQDHGGNILIESEPDEGTTVKIRIPVRQGGQE
jgi:two-component system, NtrC family, sensor kinase